MTSPLTELSAGHTFPPFEFSVDADRSRAYRAAAGDSLPLYEEAGVVPSLAVAAVALGVLLETVALPAGSLHASEYVEFRAAVAPGEALSCSARLAQRSQRAGYIVSVLETQITSGGRSVVFGRATVMTPVPA